MLNQIKQQIITLLSGANVAGEIDISTPPNPDMGDFAFACFNEAKQRKQNPAEVANEIADILRGQPGVGIFDRVDAVGPYVNFFLNSRDLVEDIFARIEARGAAYGAHEHGANKTVLLEFACPNPWKILHVGHLKNILSGESLARVLENAGYDVLRVNYQGDVGMHVAKALWGIMQMREEYELVREAALPARVAFLGKAYAHGATRFKDDAKAHAAIQEMNEKIYTRDASIQAIYDETRQWSLDYFAYMYDRLNTGFDAYYFESEMDERGRELVAEGQKQCIFQESDGAIIFPGSEYGLHDRVFINSKGFPTYEGKELALAEKHFTAHNPDAVIHVVGKEQTEYFKVLIKAIEKMFPETAGKERHIPGGYLQLKGEQKMSSRTGNVISAEDLVDAVELRIREIMQDNNLDDADTVISRVAHAALAYAMLKTHISQDVAFDMEASVSTNGDSGPYLLYIVARINSILEKADAVSSDYRVPETLSPEEHTLVLRLAAFEDVTRDAADQYDPSQLSKYVFALAQDFNQFYNACPVIENGETQQFRVHLIQTVKQTMEHGLRLLGIESVERM